VTLDTALGLRGRTVTLRPLAVADAEALAAAAAESREPYGYTRVPDGVEDARRYIALPLTGRDAGRRLPLAILWQDRLVGSTSVLEIQRSRWPADSPRQRNEDPDVACIVWR
jgi:hypothetical protein